MAWQDFLRNNSQMFLQAGAGLLGGRNPQEQMAMGVQGLTDARRMNQTMKYLQSSDPELAQAVGQGLVSPADAFKMSYERKLEAQRPKKPIEVGGRLVDPDTYQVVADFSTPAKPNRSFQTLPDGTYGMADLDNGSFSALGRAPKAGSGDVSQREVDAARLGLTPDNPAYQSYVLTGKMPREDAQTLTATDKKAMWAAEDEIPSLDSTISSLKRAKDLNKKTFTGVTAGARGWLGSSVPGGDYLVDGEAAKATSEFNKIMSMEAIQSMAQTLKGATTDRELAQFVEILADPSTPPDIRDRTIDRMTQLAERVKDVKVNRVNELRGKPGGPSPAMPAADNPYKSKYGLE